MTLLITGGAGFIGSNLVRLVAAQPQVRKIVNLDCLTYAGHLENLAGVEHTRYVFEKVDLRDLAAESHVDRSITGPGDFIQTNIVGTFHLLEACRDHWQGREGVKFHHVSTDEVYGSLGATGLFTETTP